MPLSAPINCCRPGAGSPKARRCTGLRNGIILDPFMGSGSTGKAALLESFNFVGIELNPDYITIAKKRIQPLLVNKKLF